MARSRGARNGRAGRRTALRSMNGRRGRRPGRWGVILSALVLALLLTLLATGGVALAAAVYYQQIKDELPAPERLIERPLFQSTRIYDRNGNLMAEFFDPRAGHRIWVSLKDVSPAVIQATLATEDPNFYNNPGVDWRAFIRAAIQNITGGRIESGASTITMQLVRNALFDPEERLAPSINRKIKELLLAYEISQQYPKDQILEMYLNEVYYGNLAYGIESAAQTYFGKPARELNLAEAALLAGIPQAPADYNPFTNFDLTKRRQEMVLDLMVKHGFITPNQAKEAKAAPLQFAEPKQEVKAPHFVNYVRDLLIQKYGEQAVFNLGLQVITSLDLDLQQAAEQIIREHMPKIRPYRATNAALVAINPNTGEILTMVGSADFYDQSIDGQVNVALSFRQPGSAIKPITYAAAFERGWTPATIVDDSPLEIRIGNRIYRPNNHDFKFRGPIPIRKALAGSLNIPAIRTIQFVGVENMIELAKDMGVVFLREDPVQCGVSITLGGCEVRLLDLTSAFGVFAAQGVRHPPVAILKITDYRGRVLEEFKPGPGKRVLRPEVAFLVTDILADNDARSFVWGPNSLLKLASRPAAAKTGTTEYNQDGWQLGYTPDLVVGVWVGNSDGSPMGSIYGIQASGPIWNRFMEYAHREKPVKQFPVPPGVVRMTVCAETGLPINPTATPTAGRPQNDEPRRDQPGSDESQGRLGCTPVTDWFIKGQKPVPGPTISSQTPTPTATPGATPAPAGTPSPTPARSGGPLVMPSVVGRPIQDALASLESLGLEVHQQTRPSNQAPPGQVISQSPAPGTQLIPGTAVTLVVSAGPSVTVPNVIGRPEAEAKQLIQQAGLVNFPTVTYQGRGMGIPDEVLNRVCVGCVLSSDPPPGATVPPGTEVKIAVRRD
ncbi:MAG: penicillin-binding protein [Chloroflexota bacterium]